MNKSSRSTWPPALFTVLQSAAAFFLLFSLSEASLLRVDPAGGGDYLTVASAMAVATTGDTIAVVIGDHSASNVEVVEGVQLLGGWNPTFTARNPGDSHLVAVGSGPILRLSEGQTTATLIDGFEFSGATQSAIWCTSSSATITNNDMHDNSAADGGGVHCDNGSSPRIENNHLHHNHAEYGGAIRSHVGAGNSPTIRHNLIEYNSANVGGGIGVAVGSPLIEGNVIQFNDAVRGVGTGGGVHITYADGEVRANLIIDNVAFDGGGIAITAGNPTIANNTVWGNHALHGGAMFEEDGGFDLAIVSHNILGGSDLGSGVYVESAPALELECNCVFGNAGGDYVGIAPGSTDILQDPLFCDLNGFLLASLSPCAPSGACGLIGAFGVGCGYFTNVTSVALADTGHATGAAWVDLDGDGDLDLHVLRTQGETDLSYQNQGAGAFALLVSPALTDPGNGQGMDWGDYDNDGDLDLYLVNANSANKLLRNDGGGSFVDITTPPLNYGCCDEGATWVDYNRDGHLDVYLTTASGQPNHLYRNLGGGTFVDATPPTLAITARCASSAWADYDGDGDSDVFVCVVDGPDRLVRNDAGGSFTDVTAAPLNDAGAAQGASWGDYDNDGDLDLYLCNFGQANRLFRNDGAGFVDVAAGPLADANQGQSGTWADFDNDRDLDLALTNFGQPSHVLRNDGGNAFVSVAAIGDTTHSLGAAWGDYDEDGDEDLFVANFGSSDKLFRNDGASGNNWLDVTLQGTTSNRSAIGARVIAADFASGVTQMREHGSNHGFWSCNASAEHFGLGSSTHVDLLVVRWPSGSLQSFQNVLANQRITVVEGGGIVGVQPELAPEALAVRVRPNPFRQGTEILCSGGREGSGVVKIFDVQGRLLRTLTGQVPGLIPWNGRDAGGRAVSNGIYFYRLTAGERTLTGKVVRIR